ncbi:LOW QUALITY PROTEIN: transient receptor potential cation channel subfamily M member 2-like [Penaeus monodon]|uniref:LOW QUALITY PROTEIN: transient receptor potential cation channel subfamily M member 2-like n=1 Tax=Penaeus monodon TaxID=6687 RepID=UPI0018A7501D|nr:LOW QUALITY PROTEIN: transient receptor potential cation channel subfamily M member 2-like [Penaeus monodon]
MALKKNIPVVVVGGTGRAADLLAYAVSMTVRTASGRYILRRQYVTQLMNKILAAMTELQGKTEKQKKCADYVLECCARANMIITFDIDCGEGLDHCILYALLTGGAQSSRLEQLSLALLWDRPDIAEHHIFPAESNWASWDLKDLMTTALLEEKVEFVKLFILNGLVMSDYLNVTTLRYLYNEACKTESHTHLRRLLQRSSRSSYHYLVHVHNILQAMLRKHHDPVYLSDTPQAVMADSSINYLTFDDPYQELLLWAIFSRRGQLARFLWERCETPLCAAVVASCVYQSLWKSLGAKNTVILNEYQKQKTMFETLAVELQDVCYQEDPPNAMGLVERRNPKWGQMDCLELAHLANDLMFISTPCSQASVELNWRRGLTRAPPLAVTICNFLPFLVWTRLFGFQKLGDNGGELTAWQKLVVFYKSPISKFFAHSTSFVVFLLLYAYVILFDFKYEMSVAEILVICWIFTFIVGELSEITAEQSTSVRGKISDWLNSVWNRFDLMAIVLALLALALRLHRETFKWGRIAYSLNTTLFYCRLFRIYHVNYHLGPKLVIFYRMISEVLVFMALLVIFILGYGIASQGLMYPGRDVSSLNLTDVGQIMREVLLTPYWQMYGELLLDDIKGGDVETCYPESCTVPESCVTEGRNCIQDCVCENAKEYTWAVNLMLFIYLIIGNIMLLNLLIAIFTYVFDEVQENSMEIWKFEMYRLIREYDSKPALVPPFVVLEYVWRIMKAIWKVTCRKKKENLEDYMKYTLTSLKIFEKECIQTYLARVTAAEEGKLGNRVKKIGEKIDKVSKYIEQREEIEEMEDDLEWMKEDEEQSSRDVSGPCPPAADRTPQRRPPQTSTPWQLPPPPLANAMPTTKTTSKRKAAKRSRGRRKAMAAAPDSTRSEEEDGVEDSEEARNISEGRWTFRGETGRGNIRGMINELEQEENRKDIEKETIPTQASERPGKESRPHTSQGRHPAGSRVAARLDELQATQVKMSEILQKILKKIQVSEAKDRAREEEEDRRRRRRGEKEGNGDAERRQKRNSRKRRTIENKAYIKTSHLRFMIASEWSLESL